MDVAVLVVDGVADFGLAAVLEVIGTANALRDDQQCPSLPWSVTTVGLRAQVTSGAGHTVPTTPIGSLTRQPDLMIVPATNVKRADALIELVSGPGNRAALQFIAEARASNIPLAAACTGTFFLAEAGVLDDSQATTSWWLAPVFRRRYPRVQLVEDQTVCRAAGITTAGAAVAHIDLACALVRTQSPALAEVVSRYLLIANRGSQMAFAIPAVLAASDPRTAAFERWVRSHLGQPFQIAEAAQAIGLSERSLQRATAVTLGMTPLDFVHELRLDHAVHLLRATTQTTDAVAAAVGYLNASTLRDLVRRRRGLTIRQLRAGP